MQLALALDGMASRRVLVVGDVILDRYTWGNVERVSPEAPVPILVAETHEARLGGAASVARLLRALDAEVILAGVVGPDSNGRVLRALLHEESIDPALVVTDEDRVTTAKERFFGRAGSRHPHQIVRVDHEVRTPLPQSLERELVRGIASRLSECDVLLVSDYAKGMCTPGFLGALMELASRRDVAVVVDPARVRDCGRYRGATILTPNRVEAELAFGQKIETAREAIAAGEVLRLQCEAESVVVTLDREGMVLVTQGEAGRLFPTKPREVYDITGAGDMVLAVIGLCEACGIGLPTAIRLANVAAGLEVERWGVAPIGRAELKETLLRSGEETFGAPEPLEHSGSFPK